MNKLIALLLFFPVISFAQRKKQQEKKVLKDTVLFKGVNKIIIENNNTINQNFFLLQTELSKRGYDVKINRKEYVLSTKDSIMSSGSTTYNFVGLINDKQIELTGKYITNAIASPLGEVNHVFKYDIEYSGAEKALPKKLFVLLMEIANHIDGKKTYINETGKKRGAIF